MKVVDHYEEAELSRCGLLDTVTHDVPPPPYRIDVGGAAGRRQPEPRGEVPGRLDLLAIPHRSDEGRCCQGAYAWRGCKSLADGA